ncbi:MAG: LysR family transcriptional regulator [Hyphomicrobiales bacterium]|nr:LysR family transcriptional regulator [Hyphomicrobiales bacterium]
MSEETLSGLGLDLLRTLQALLDEPHVSSAAAKLGITQPTMSQRLKRLREIFRDPLLVSGRNGLHLTPRALALRHPLRNFFTAFEAMLRSTSQAASVERKTNQSY